MDDLPPPIILDILTRLHDSADLARCRAASKTLNAVAREVRCINLMCSFGRYMRSRSPEARALVTPFKEILKSLIMSSTGLESLSFGVEKPLRGIQYEDVEDESEDLYLTNSRFVAEWLPWVSDGLRKLSMSDFWIQSCWRRSEVLPFISSCCHGLLELEVKNAWLSVDGLKCMPTLTSLTLEFIRLDDEELDRVNDCFPSLQVLNLIGVGGLKDPKICLLHLKTCHWTISNAPYSITICAPNLTELKLKCVKPEILVIETPLLSEFHLSIDKASKFVVKEFVNLRTLQLESSSLCSLISKFSFGGIIRKLTVDSSKWTEPVERTKLSLGALVDVFPNTRFLRLSPSAWSEVEACYRTHGIKGWNGMNRLKEMVAYLVVNDIENTLAFVFSILDRCTNLLDISLLIHRDVDAEVFSSLILRCTSGCPRLRWRWGLWKEGTRDAWVVSDGV